MHQRGVLLFCLVTSLYTGLAAAWPVSAPDYPSGTHCVNGNTEALYACGRRLRLSTAELFEIELIPGMNAELADGIMKERDQILLDTSRRRVKELALERVHGIGRAKARKFGQYLDLR